MSTARVVPQAWCVPMAGSWLVWCADRPVITHYDSHSLITHTHDKIEFIIIITTTAATIMEYAQTSNGFQVDTLESDKCIYVRERREGGLSIKVRVKYNLCRLITPHDKFANFL